MKKITVRLDDDLHLQYKILLLKEDKSIQEDLIEYIKKRVENKED